MKLTQAPVLSTRYKIHDGVINYRVPMCGERLRVGKISWHVLPGHAGTNCRKCLALRRKS